MGRRQHDGGRLVATLFSTTFVLLGGAVFCTFVIISFVNDPLPHLIGCAALFTGLALLTWWMGRQPGSGLSFQMMLPRFLRRRREADVGYRPRRKVRFVEFGTNTPPTAQSAREAAEQGNANWRPRKQP